MKLRTKLGLFNLLSKITFGIAFMIITPLVLEHINTLQTDEELIDKREHMIDIIAEWGVDFLLDQDDAFGSYNILREEYISLEWVELDQEWNFIEVTQRQVEGEVIDYRVLNYSFLVDGEMYLLEIGKSLKSIRQAEKNIRSVTFAFLIIFVLVSLISDFSFAGRLIKPLEVITSRLKKTTSPSLYDPVALKTTTLEFEYLDNTLRELMYKMGRLFENEKQTTANISHELLTPVSILRSKLENLLDSPDLNHQQAVKIEESLKTIYRLKTMVNSLLLIARLESQQYLKEDDFQISQVIDEAIEELLPLSDDKEIQFIKNLDAGIFMTKANKALLFTMFYNVLNNAIKFTPEGGTISVSTVNDRSGQSVTVTDTGNGMDQAQIDRLFSRFKKKSVPDETGSGIGLAIARSIADFHHIKIKVESAPGQGSSFIFDFAENS
jgi:signal transduction histidine kinase